MREGFYIKPIDLNDEDEVFFVFKCRTNPSIAKNLFNKPPATLAVHKRFLRTNVPNKMMMYLGMVEAVPVGYCIAYGFDGNDVKIGFIVHPDWQRQGFGSKMINLMTAEMKKIFPQKQICVHVKADNTLAMKLYEKHGFKQKYVRMDLE